MDFFLWEVVKETVYSSGGSVTFVEQLKHQIEYSFHFLKTMCNIGENLGRNVEMSSAAEIMKRKKEKKERKGRIKGRHGIMMDLGYLRVIIDAIFSASECKM